MRPSSADRHRAWMQGRTQPDAQQQRLQPTLAPATASQQQRLPPPSSYSPTSTSSSGTAPILAKPYHGQSGLPDPTVTRTRSEQHPRHAPLPTSASNPGDVHRHPRQLPALQEMLNPTRRADADASARYASIDADRRADHVMTGLSDRDHAPAHPWYPPQPPSIGPRNTLTPGRVLPPPLQTVRNLGPGRAMAPPPAILSAAISTNNHPRTPLPEMRNQRASLQGHPFAQSDAEPFDARRDSARPLALSSLTTNLECVGHRAVPGKGPCLIYNDGTVCPTVINSDEVSLEWGYTKAGKPRKRLAQACL